MRFTNHNIIGLPPRSSEPSRLPQGGDTPTSAVFYDLTERQQSEKYQQWLTMLVESSSDAIIGKSLAGVILSWNEVAERLFGYAAVKVVGQPVSMLFAPSEANELQLLLQRCGRGEHIESHETQCIRQDGQPICVSLVFSPVKNKAGSIVGIATIARDITKRKQAEDRLHHLAFHDGLTGLPNRFLLRERISQALVQARRHEHQVALLFIDLNCFKEINDSLGHQIGDRLLQLTANRLRGSLREGDTVARLGGDEFVVCLSGLTESDDATLIAGKIYDTLRESFRIGSHKLNISGSIGMSIYPRDGKDMETLMHAADSRMFHTKKKVRGESLAPNATKPSPNLIPFVHVLQGHPEIN